MIMYSTVEHRFLIRDPYLQETSIYETNSANNTFYNKQDWEAIQSMTASRGYLIDLIE